MKKCFSKIIFLAVLILTLSSCSKEEVVEKKDLNVVCSNFVCYDWARNIIGDVSDVHLNYLQTEAGDIHNFQPSLEDIALVSDSDIFIYIGGQSDNWVKETLQNSFKEESLELNILSKLGDKALLEKPVNGGEFVTESYDEHIWLSITYPSFVCKFIRDALIEKDPDNESAYKDNCDLYLEELDALAMEFYTVEQDAVYRTLIFADQFPFRYLMEDLCLTYFGAFSGCGVETEASFDTIIFLANKLDELKLNRICVLEKSDEKIARAVIENSKQKDVKIVEFNSMQHISKSNLEDGATYIEIMQENLEALNDAVY